MRDCVICQGSRHVRLPVYSRATAYCDHKMYDTLMGAPVIEESYRTYPCPECAGEQAAEEKVAIVYAEYSFRSHGGEPERGIQEAAAKHLAMASAEKFLRDGFIEIRQERRVDEIVFRSRLGVVSPRMVATIERRAFDKMKGFLRGVREKAAEAIAVWGAAYTGNEGMISKGQAIDYVRSAFDSHLAEIERDAKP